MPADNTINIFISYSNNKEDRSKLDDLVKMLRPLQRNKTIKIWDDSHIEAGDKWDDEIKDNLNIADIVLLLLSPDFFDSRYINETELAIIFNRRERQECKVVPILIKKCPWEEDPRISETAILPKDKKSRKLLQIVEWERENDAFFEIYEELKYLISNMQKSIEKATPSKRSINNIVDTNNSWSAFFSKQRLKKELDIAPLMSVKSDRKEHFKQLLQHFKKHKDKTENLVYLISACPKQNPASIAKRLVYFFEEDFTDFIRHEKYQKELRTLSLKLKSSEAETWKTFWKSFQHEFLKTDVDEEIFFTNPSNWLEGHNRVALTFEIEENDLIEVEDEVQEHLRFILAKFDALPPKYRKFVFFFVFHFPGVHSHRANACQCYLDGLNIIITADGIMPEEFHKLHIYPLGAVSEDDVIVWAHSVLESTHVDNLLSELRKSHSDSKNKNDQIQYDMSILEDMQYGAYAFLRGNK